MKSAILAVMAVLFQATTLTAVSTPPKPVDTVQQLKEPDNKALARITVYWAKGPGTDRWSKHFKSSTGVRLKPGHCAVDPDRIPYFAKVNIGGVGKFLAVDTGTDVINRKAAKRLGRNKKERSALVVDLFYTTRDQALQAAESLPRFAIVSW